VLRTDAPPLARGLLDAARMAGDAADALDAMLGDLDVPRYSIARAARHLKGSPGAQDRTPTTVP